MSFVLSEKIYFIAEPHSHIIAIQYQHLIVFSSSCEVCGWSYFSIDYWLPKVMTWASATVLWWECIKCIKLLGVWLTDSLTWPKLTSVVVKQAEQRPYSLRKTKTNIFPTIRHTGHRSIKCRTRSCSFLLQAVRLLTSQLKRQSLRLNLQSLCHTQALEHKWTRSLRDARLLVCFY